MIAEFYRFWVINPKTRKPDLTAAHMTRTEAAEVFPGAEPEMRTYELREIPGKLLGQEAVPSDRGREWHGQSVNTADIALHLGLSRKYVTDRLTKEPDFPTPFISLGRRAKRWLRADVEAWLAKGAQRTPQA